MLQLRVTMWSLVTGAATYIQYPIHPDRGKSPLQCGILVKLIEKATGYAFRQDARYFVLAERHKSKDTLGVYDAHEAYRLVRVRRPLRIRETISKHDRRAVLLLGTALSLTDRLTRVPLALADWQLSCGMGRSPRSAHFTSSALISLQTLTAPPAVQVVHRHTRW